MGGLMQPAIDMATRKVAAKVAAETKESTMLKSIRNLMKNMKWSAQQAMNALGIPDNEQPKYTNLLG